MQTPDNQPQNAIKTAKRPVGRPKMVKPESVPLTREGIVNEPKIKCHVLEMSYDEPMNIKRIFNLFKLVDMRDVRMEFKLKSIRISGSGHLKQNFIELTIDADRMKHYYCKHEMIVVIDQRNLEKIIQKIDKSYDEIQFIATQESYMKDLNIVLHDISQGVKEFHTVSLLETSTCSDDNVISAIDYHSYPIRFTFPNRYFKKVISDISKFSQDLTIDSDKNCRLSFPYDSNAKTIEVRHTFTNLEMFNFHSTLGPNELLSTAVRIEYVQSLANAMLSDSVDIFVDHENLMIFRSNVDSGAFKLILAVKVVSYR